ncbi:MAG: hypothetical protein WBQ20_13510, partial [Methyloceanibacter sp.]
ARTSPAMRTPAPTNESWPTTVPAATPQHAGSHPPQSQPLYSKSPANTPVPHEHQDRSAERSADRGRERITGVEWT